MILMALDHVRDFFHSAAMTGSPTNLAATTPATFLTRWITHFCAPAFLLLAGIGARLWMDRSCRSKQALSRFLLTRGLWLLFLEVVVMRFLFDFTYNPHDPILLITLWSLGMSMILLAALIYLPPPALATLSIAVICLHNLTDKVQTKSWLWTILHQPGVIQIHGLIIVVGYPIASFAATMAAGYCLGALYRKPALQRRRILTYLGIAMVAAFLILRAINIYGDPNPWQPQSTHLMTVLSFLNVTKYPASLDFLLMTLGPALLLLAALDQVRVPDSNPVLIFGQVPLFYFLGHFFLAHAILAAMTGILVPPPSMGGPRDLFPKNFGYSLPTVYFVWLLVVAAMYPACRWFARVKAHNPNQWWLTYL